MIFFVDSGGTIFKSIPEKVYQGSVNANTIYLVGAFPSNCSVTLLYRLPNGNYTTPELMARVTESDLTDIQTAKGQGYNVWSAKINGVATENYGTVAVQFFVYATDGTGGSVRLATASSSFNVERGVPIVLPDKTDYYESLLTEILAVLSNIQSGGIDLNSVEEYVKNIPQNIVLTENTLDENGEVNEGTKAKWQHWLGLGIMVGQLRQEIGTVGHFYPIIPDTWNFAEVPVIPKLGVVYYDVQQGKLFRWGGRAFLEAAVLPSEPANVSIANFPDNAASDNNVWEADAKAKWQEWLGLGDINTALGTILGV